MIKKIILYIFLCILERSVGDESANRFDEADLVGANALALAILVLNVHSFIENRCDCGTNFDIVKRIDLRERRNNRLGHNVDFNLMMFQPSLGGENIDNVVPVDDEFHFNF